MINKSFTRGFTLVELLIVIVVIAILAAIAVVAYNGITNRGKTSAAQSAAAIANKKAHAYFIETGSIAPTFATLTSATSDKSYALTGVTLSGTAFAAAPSSPSTVNYYLCGTANAGVATSYATITIATGAQLRTWNYTTSAVDTAVQNSGQVSGTSSGGYAINCFISTT